MPEPFDPRAAVGQLADDLSWLEDHCRRQESLAAHAGQLRLAAALSRNVVGPFLDGQDVRPLHIAVVGGAGAGKSTVVNFLAGTVVAEANPQAGYTRHPTAYLPAASNIPWPSHLGFLGPLQRMSQDKPANLDEDVYQVKRIPAKSGGDPLADFVVWDCPDMTTWASANYVSRLIEVAALADVIVYVASDERYNDEVPTQFLHMLVKAGKAVVVVLTKMREADATALADHFRREVLGRLPKLPDGTTPQVPVLPIPNLTAAQRTDPAGAGAAFRVALLNQVLVLCEDETSSRTRTVTNAVHYLAAAGTSLLEVARRDLAELEAWKGAVLAGKAEFEERYRREFLSGEQFRQFDRTRDRIMELLELPGAGRTLSTVLWGLRTPYRLARNYLAGLLTRPNAMNLNERTVLDAALLAWLDHLQTEARKKTGSHALWKQITHGFDAGLAMQARERYQQEYRSYELKQTDEIEQAGRELTENLEKNSTLLNSLRGGKAAIDLVVIISIVTVSWTWPPNAWLLLLLPLGVSLTHQIEELVVRSIVEAGRLRVRHRRESLVSEALTTPLADWLTAWPSTGGTSFERLHQVMRRVPETIGKLESAVNLRTSLKRDS